MTIKTTSRSSRTRFPREKILKLGRSLLQRSPRCRCTYRRFSPSLRPQASKTDPPSVLGNPEQRPARVVADRKLPGSRLFGGGGGGLLTAAPPVTGNPA